jgi:predicted amidohydrolase
LKIALASPPLIGSIEGALSWVARLVAAAAAGRADIVCFPETVIPGIRGQEFAIDAHDPEGLRAARASVCRMAARHGIAVVLPMEWPDPRGILNLAWVISAEGSILGCQAKTQLAPEEDPFYVAGKAREIFEVHGVTFGIAICHEGWRYPETVRWAAVRGAKLVFHPHQHGSDRHGQRLSRFGSPEAPWFEKAMVCRAQENDIYFASVNFAHSYQTAATAVIGPDGACLVQAPYGEPGVIFADIDPAAATGLYAKRFAPETYREGTYREERYREAGK